MNIIRRADVHNIYRFVTGELIERLVSPLDPQRAPGLLRPFRRAAQNPDYRNALPTKRFHMRSADETYANDCGLETAQGFTSGKNNLGTQRLTKEREPILLLHVDAPARALPAPAPDQQSDHPRSRCQPKAGSVGR